MKSLSRRSPPLHRALGSHQCPSVGGIIAQKKAGGGDQSEAAARGECEF